MLASNARGLGFESRSFLMNVTLAAKCGIWAIHHHELLVNKNLYTLEKVYFRLQVNIWSSWEKNSVIVFWEKSFSQVQQWKMNSWLKPKVSSRDEWQDSSFWTVVSQMLKDVRDFWPFTFCPLGKRTKKSLKIQIMKTHFRYFYGILNTNPSNATKLFDELGAGMSQKMRRTCEIAR